MASSTQPPWAFGEASGAQAYGQAGSSYANGTSGGGYVPQAPARGLSLLDEWAPVLDSLAQQSEQQRSGQSAPADFDPSALGAGAAQNGGWPSYPAPWDFLAQQPLLGQNGAGQEPFDYAGSAAHTPSYAGSVSDYNASDSDFLADVDEGPSAPFQFGGAPPVAGPSFVDSGTYTSEPDLAPDPSSLPFGADLLAQQPPKRQDTLTQTAELQALITGQPVEPPGRPWSRQSTTQPRQRSFDQPFTNSPDQSMISQYPSAQRRDSSSRSTLAFATPPPELPPSHSQRPSSRGADNYGSPLFRLAIPDLPPDVESIEETPIANDKTAGPETARPNAPRSRGTNEVDKLLRELSEQAVRRSLARSALTAQDRQVVDPNAAPQPWNGFLPPLRPPQRQRSVSDVSGASPTVMSFNYGLPPNFQQLYDPRAAWNSLDVMGGGGFDATRSGDIAVGGSSSVPAYSPAPFYSSDSEHSDGRESQAGPRRRSDVHSHERPTWSPYGGDGVGAGPNMRRSYSVGQQDYAVGPSYAPPVRYGYAGDASGFGVMQPPRPGSAHSFGSGSHHSRSSSFAGPDGTDIIPKPVHFQSQTTDATKAAAAARRKPGTEAKYVCDYCGRYNLAGHLRAHNGERPYVCNEPGCDKSVRPLDGLIARKHDLRRHSALHDAVMKYPCAGCGKAFKRLDALSACTCSHLADLRSQRHHRSDAGRQCAAKIAAGKGLALDGDASAGESGAVWL